MEDRIPTVKEVLLWRVLNRPIDERWVNWAVSMLQAGRDTPHMAILAGAVLPFNQFGMVALVDKVLKELGCDWSDRESVVKDYAVELLEEMLTRTTDPIDTVRVLSHLCIELGYPHFLMDFYSLYFAEEDLGTIGVQWFLPDATGDNIESIIRQYATKWIRENRRT